MRLVPRRRYRWRVDYRLHPMADMAGNIVTPTSPQIGRLYAIAKAHGWTRDGVHRLIEANYGKRSTKDLEIQEYNAVCDFLEQSKAADVATMNRDKNTPDLFGETL